MCEKIEYKIISKFVLEDDPQNDDNELSPFLRSYIVLDTTNFLLCTCLICVIFLQ